MNTESAASTADRLRAAVHWLLPTRLLSRLTWHVARSPRPWLKNRLNRFLVRRYGLDLSEAEHSDPTAYPTFYALFTRALRPGARPLPEDPQALISPCDGTVSAVGHLHGERLIQAKGIEYSLRGLLHGLDPAPFRDGAFVTIYLSPRDYHRFHAPVAGRLQAERHVPGRLLTVAPSAVRAIRGLFLRNERHVTLWETVVGLVAVVPVGAVNVGSIETVWGGPVGEAPGLSRDFGPGEGVFLGRGEELGRFNLGSTVVVVLPAGVVRWADGLVAGRPVRMGEVLGRLRRADAR
ncbi:phosphatidylserine decarboxylase [Halorhodospira halophila SL1]|uniref:Phosphatidylserine decarboxylase proenzyme n=1 Tax=Halorhodospira halophila (strain DSM 244 / SL1) TaxID=349124 RepID=PSD_HALHL|nr:archaetidylserine decarboxylase [Halorhodospira halophila]A1WV88.1 RecName: Full=Phosphatidylserine decarboxylase proenzyme; Contains: RecName: Full=Phosphatidylserine decarboxylase alpha chain; Contains: RecName: Full=Phosphatidylserine decarboxylase beta chain [Halorhodospira halophila SL1]ABM61600.1 phosphatidylserine decarboxylase [Halorhodospira halophila SL1]